MSTRFLRIWVWVGTLLAGGTLTLILNRIFPHTDWIFLFGASYLVSGWILDATVRTYEPWEREHFARKYGRGFPLLIGLGGPFYLAWEFSANLWRYS